jgi:hypothetical protein
VAAGSLGLNGARELNSAQTHDAVTRSLDPCAERFRLSRLKQKNDAFEKSKFRTNFAQNFHSKYITSLLQEIKRSFQEETMSLLRTSLQTLAAVFLLSVGAETSEQVSGAGSTLSRDLMT